MATVKKERIFTNNFENTYFNSAVTAVCFINETYVVSASKLGRVFVWRLDTSHPVHQLEGHTDTVDCLQVLGNRKYVVTGCMDGIGRIFSVIDGCAVAKFGGHLGGISCMDTKVIGQSEKTETTKIKLGAREYIITGSSDNTARLIDARSAKTLAVLRHSGPLHAVKLVAHNLNGAVSDLNHRAFTVICEPTYGPRVFVWNVGHSHTSKIEITELTVNPLKKVTLACFKGSLAKAAISPEGRFVATSSTQEEKLCVWSLDLGSLSCTIVPILNR